MTQFETHTVMTVFYPGNLYKMDMWKTERVYAGLLKETSHPIKFTRRQALQQHLETVRDDIFFETATL